VDREEYDSSKKMRYLYRSGAANGPDFSPTASSLSRRKLLPIKFWAGKQSSPKKRRPFPGRKRTYSVSKKRIRSQ
jgi:hypothetical protein